MPSENFIDFDRRKMHIMIADVNIEDIAPQSMGGTTGIVPYGEDTGSIILEDLRGVPITRTMNKTPANTRARGAISVYSGSPSVKHLNDLVNKVIDTDDKFVFTAEDDSGLGFKSITLSHVKMEAFVPVATDNQPIYTYGFTGWDYQVVDID